MGLSPMKYGDYTWPHNPRTYEILYNRRIVCHKVPFGLYVLQDMGREQRILRGEGEFTGRGAYDEFKRLATMFYSSESKILVHPVWQSAPAWFVRLKLKQEPREDYVKYEFEFWECFEGYETAAIPVMKATSEKETPSAAVGTERKTHVIRRGDTLWGLAKANGLTLAQLLEKNPQIRNPNIYYCGDVVYLS